MVWQQSHNHRITCNEIESEELKEATKKDVLHSLVLCKYMAITFNGECVLAKSL